MGDMETAVDGASLIQLNRWRTHPKMKVIIKVLLGCSLLAVIAWAMVYISGEENSIRLNNDWGIAKDHPIK
jgi:hypothetical protein